MYGYVGELKVTQVNQEAASLDKLYVTPSAKARKSKYSGDILPDFDYGFFPEYRKARGNRAFKLAVTKAETQFPQLIVSDDVDDLGQNYIRFREYKEHADHDNREAVRVVYDIDANICDIVIEDKSPTVRYSLLSLLAYRSKKALRRL